MEHKYNNKLIDETSPYLLQHAHNPVNWIPWSDEAFEIAKNEQKLVLISIGYAACHWCHVMEKESFENEQIAEAMNKNFICIKVDREERPDVDQIYMNAIQILTGNGGWPLNCFALPDKRPIYAGTYYRSKQWLEIVEGLATTYKHEPQRIQAAANELELALINTELIKLSSSEIQFEAEEMHIMFSNWKPYFDTIWGGNKQAPKFPLPISLQFLLNYGFVYNIPEAMNQAHLTLSKIAQGGIYDHVAGGFARYSVDAQWMVPHFEKMLYDNSQLVSVYSQAYKQKNIRQYKTVTEKTLNFISQELTSPQGAFYSSYDADSECIEGKFYVWKKSEIIAILGKDADWFCAYFNITSEGNWEHSNILWVTEPDRVMQANNFTEQTIELKTTECLQLLYNERIKRIKPALDDKVLTAWNALMSIGFLDVYEAFGNQNDLNIAIKNAIFIRNNMWQSREHLYRNYKNGKANINGFLDDYALTIQLFIKIYQCTFDEKWIFDAKCLLEYCLDHFYNKPSGMFYYTNVDDSVIVTRKTEVMDNVMPSSNSIMGQNLFVLSHYFDNSEWYEMARQMLANMLVATKNNVSYYANWGLLYQRFLNPVYEIVIIGPNANVYCKEFTKLYLANVIMAGALTINNSNLTLLQNRGIPNETVIYICKNKVCQLPVKSVEEALTLLK